MRTFAILPIKSFSQAKQRLRLSSATPTARALVDAMFSDVLVALRRVPALERIIVVSGDRVAQRIARRLRRDRRRGRRAGTQRGGRARASTPRSRTGSSGAARARRLPAARPQGDRGAARPPGRRALGADRPRPPRHRDERAPAHAAGRARAELRPDSRRAPHGRRAARRRARRGRRGARRSRSTSTRPRTSRRCRRSRHRGGAAQLAACSTS